ncbi:hypothetical protein UACE39S_00309 [Ureibacillus acetophenoni]
MNYLKVFYITFLFVVLFCGSVDLAPVSADDDFENHFEHYKGRYIYYEESKYFSKMQKGLYNFI